MAFEKKNQSKARTIIIVIICAILALSMTIPSVAMILSRNNSASSSSSSTSSTTSSSDSQKATLLATSQGYDSSFTDLKNAWRNSSNPSSYEDTFKTNYDSWIATLYQYTTENTLTDSDEIAQAYQLAIDSIKDTQSSSVDSSAYDQYLAYAYYSYAFSLMSCASNTGDDLSSQLGICYSEGIGYSDSALAYSYSSDTAGDLATMYYWDGQTDQAIATATDALDHDPTNATIWYNLGNYYFSAQKYELAQEAYNKALEVDPDDNYGVQSAANTQLQSLSAHL